MDLGLTGRVALVLAASKGLGRASAAALAAEGADVVIGARDRSTLEDTAAHIRARTGRRVLAVPVDVTDAAQARAFVDAALAEFGRIDILVNNAGGPPFGVWDDFDDAAWQRAFELSLQATVRMTRLVVPHLPHDGGGRVINVLSLTVKSAVPGSMLSTALRNGVVGMAKLLSDELGPHGITVNNVLPGFILTERLKEFPNPESVAATIPMRRFGDPEEFASVITFIASERASYITGATIPVDGGSNRALI